MALFMKNDKKSTYISRPELLSFRHGGPFGSDRNIWGDEKKKSWNDDFIKILSHFFRKIVEYFQKLLEILIFLSDCPLVKI